MFICLIEKNFVRCTFLIWCTIVFSRFLAKIASGLQVYICTLFAGKYSCTLPSKVHIY